MSLAENNITFSASKAAAAYVAEFQALSPRLKEALQNNNPDDALKQDSIHHVLQAAVERLRSFKNDLLAQALEDTLTKLSDPTSFGGLGIQEHDDVPVTVYNEVIHWTTAYLHSVESRQNGRNFMGTTHVHSARPTRPMTLAQKMFTQHALSGVPTDANSLTQGDVIRAGIDWVIASELSWSSMAKTHEELGSPGIWRNDRFWIAGDHVVHPTILDNPKIKVYVETAEKAKRDFKMTEYQGMNYTIMHTEFVRERAEPGMLIVGSDSHTCSAGAVGCLSIGLGAADVMTALALGETWWKVPDSVLIDLTGKPAFGISGKDVILHILKELKRNTVAAERIVEFAGDGVQHLSIDARFAICNMCTEFGAITGLFVPDAVTQNYVSRRKRKAYKSNSLYFQPDKDAVYAHRYTIDLAAVEPSIAVYPNPDDVVPVSVKAGMPLDGVFIGACTTTEEELVLGALTLKVGLNKGLPLAKGKRHYVPGSLPIVEKLKELGLLEVYEAAGFTRGPPGCSLCVGLSAEKASEGETWLSSQNRNFANRMGKGSFGHLSSAVVCAASAFTMTITDPAPFLAELDQAFLVKYKGFDGGELAALDYCEPTPFQDSIEAHEATDPPANTVEAQRPDVSRSAPSINSKVITLGDFIDTDALSPGFTLTSCTTDEEFGQHVLCHTYPEFRSKVKNGQKVVVGGTAFGVGSSRESAVSALKGAGVEAVIAKQFAFIYGRNQPSLGLLGIVMEDEAFYAAAQDGEDITIDLPERVITVAEKKFPFQLSEMEYRLTTNKGVAESYRKYGKAIWEKLMEAEPTKKQEPKPRAAEQMTDTRLQW
ncbi:putative aconitate hydratase [Pseudocercospora fuligena]|uniref:Putative aconitate hydratase n=1 Tax=Pseudocercospora fuligena TaxID=685502 RepID=A0A8H6VLK7_9PEZI|nr:putative aconitate hydratase [Pseudocercospora fuligena]